MNSVIQAALLDMGWRPMGRSGLTPRPTGGRRRSRSVCLSWDGSGPEELRPRRVNRESIKDRPLALWYEHCRFAGVEWDDACGIDGDLMCAEMQNASCASFAVSSTPNVQCHVQNQERKGKSSLSEASWPPPTSFSSPGPWRCALGERGALGLTTARCTAPLQRTWLAADRLEANDRAGPRGPGPAAKHWANHGPPKRQWHQKLNPPSKVPKTPHPTKRPAFAASRLRP